MVMVESLLLIALGPHSLRNEPLMTAVLAESTALARIVYRFPDTVGKDASSVSCLQQSACDQL
jgi:hypothetical protein